MLNPMGKLPKSLARRTVGRFLRFGVLRGLRSVEIDPEEFRQYLAEKQIAERLAPRIAGRLAVRIGEESAEKWVGRMVPLASSAIGGALNYTFIRTWGRRVQRHLREKHLAERAAAAERAQLDKTISIR